MSVDKINKLLIELEEEGYFIEDIIESSFYRKVIKTESALYELGHRWMYPFFFDIKFEIFQLLDGVPEAEYKNELIALMSIILEMRIEKITFEKMKNERGKNWKNREKPKEKINRREHKNLHGIKSSFTPDEIADTNDYVRDFEYDGNLPLGYETDWYGEIRKELLYYIDDVRQSFSLPKNQKTIEDAVVKIYSKL